MALMRSLCSTVPEVHSSIWATLMHPKKKALLTSQVTNFSFTSTPPAPLKDESAGLHHQCGCALGANASGQVRFLHGKATDCGFPERNSHPKLLPAHRFLVLVLGATDAPACAETSAFLRCSRLLKVHQRRGERMLLVHATTLFSHIDQFKFNCIFRVINSQVVPQNASCSGA